jgi:uncharacterized protein
VTVSALLPAIQTPLVRIAAVAVLLSMSGCASFRSYNHEMSQTMDLAAAGNIGSAIEQLEKRHRDADKDLLYFLELGELQRLAGRLEQSQQSWMAADLQVQAWEAAARADPQKLLGAAASLMINEKLAPYTGHDYEKVMLSTRIALNHLALDQWDKARVAIRRTHEREAVIAELRARELLETEEEARKRGARTSFKDLNGYPVRSSAGRAQPGGGRLPAGDRTAPEPGAAGTGARGAGRPGRCR